MAELIAFAYPDKNTAWDVVQTLSRLQKEHVVELANVAVATKEQDGKVRHYRARPRQTCKQPWSSSTPAPIGSAPLRRR